MSKIKPLNLQFFADESDQGGQTLTPADPPAGQQQNNAGGIDAGNNGGDKSFSQEDVNGIVAKEAKKAQEKLLKQLGIDDFKSAKEGLTKFKEWQESQKSESEKQAEALKALEIEKGTLSEENATLKAQISAMKAGVNADSVEDVVTLAKTLVSDDLDMDTAIQKVVEKYPHFKGQQQQSDSKKPPTFSQGQHQKQSNGEPASLRDALAQHFSKN